MRQTTTLENYACRVETFNLSEEQHDMVLEMVKKNQHKNGNYTLEEIDKDVLKLQIWIDESEDKEYKDFLTEASSNSPEIYTLKEHLGNFSRPMGEVAIYYC